VVVPDDEHWLLLNATAALTLLVGTTFASASVDVQMSQRIQTVAFGHVSRGDGAAMATNSLLQVCFVPPTPWILRPGARVRAGVRGLQGAATTNATINIIVGRLT
jgi:hypothetical protein